jgi:hypothetical protein
MVLTAEEDDDDGNVEDGDEEEKKKRWRRLRGSLVVGPLYLMLLLAVLLSLW